MSDPQTGGVKTAGERLEAILQAAVDSSQGRFNSVTDLVEQAGLARGTLSNFKNRSLSSKRADLDRRTMRVLAESIGMSADQLARLVFPPSPSDPGICPNRVKAAFLASEAGLPESAIAAVLAEKAESDPSVWYWIKRMEAEALRTDPLAGGKPL